MPATTETIIVSSRVETTYDTPEGRAAAIEHVVKRATQVSMTGHSKESGRYTATSTDGAQPAVQDADCFVSTLRLACIVANLHQKLRAKYRSSPLWSVVCDIFGVGSTSAIKICQAANYDPHQLCAEKTLLLYK